MINILSNIATPGLGIHSTGAHNTAVTSWKVLDAEYKKIIKRGISNVVKSSKAVK